MNISFKANSFDKVLGAELSIRERMQIKVYGLGHLNITSGPEELITEIRKHNPSRIHLDQRPNGLVGRLGDKLTFSVQYDKIDQIEIIKEPDNIEPFPFTPFWFLYNIGLPIKYARWTRIRGDTYHAGELTGIIKLKDNQRIEFNLDGNMFEAVKTFFSSKFLSSFSEIKEIDTEANTM
ncbi:hypothetical protein QYS48_14780 [Marivirga arenosa]|uniref:Uncharacterized protein n=1 Tax=Marivirga arenosa TaxID=3059076 RepID=A0AA49GFU9_9BACT|nr:hypothetical protein [Marivirga sp. ABR2-2]WKK83565.2 hypothetical protein QYS48_14780 [Marivirga sp. ABR2-2]